MKTIKDLLEDSSGVSLLCGASNPLIAKLAEEAGFDGIWLSSFEMHAWNRLPDAAILNVADNADAINKISDRVDVPILVDADEGGPSAINTIRLVREYAKAGCMGVCIEDNPSPKRCSFYGMKQVLEEPSVTIGKLKAAVEKNSKENFAVIARTEALIQKHGHDVALERAKMYTDTGIDGFLIHSKADTPDEVLKFADMYHGAGIKVPLVCVPTKYNQVTKSQLNDAGFNMAIYANYSVRATVKILEKMFSDIITNETLSAGNGDIVDMERIFELIAVQELKENQEKYGS